MSLRIIAKTVAIILVVIIAILTLIVLYFFIADIQTKEPKEIDEECEIENNQFMGRKVFTIRNKQKQKGKYILYFHGGSYVAQVTQNHWDFLEKIVTDTGYTVVVPDYPLTPKYNYKDTYNMAIPLYKEIISQIEVKDLILMGDSAGGGLALGLYEYLKENNIDTPNKTILISPWLDVRMKNPDIEKIANKDDILNKDSLIIAGIAYAGKDGMARYQVNPIEGDLSKLENIIIFTGDCDILNPDAKLLQQKAGQVGGDVEIKEYENAKHIWLIDNNSETEITQKAYYDLIYEIVKND